MTKRSLATCILAIFLLFVAGSVVGADQPRLPVPSAEDQAAASQGIERRYRDFLAATQPGDQLSNAVMLLEASCTQYNNPSWRYVMAEMARQLAVEAHDLNAADAACQELASHFDFNLGALRLQTPHEADKARQGGGDTAAIIFMAMEATSSSSKRPSWI